jgi:hypothetical protein
LNSRDFIAFTAQIKEIRNRLERRTALVGDEIAGSMRETP